MTEVSLVLTDDGVIRALNQEWRGKDQATDVLSFPQYDAPVPHDVPVLGDVVISVETAARQALALGHSLSDELVVLQVHGLLHLLGYRHDAAEEREEMRAAEEGWLRRFRIREGLVERATG